MERLEYYLKLIASPNKLVHDIRIWWLRCKGMHIDRGATIQFPLHYRHPRHIILECGVVIGEGAFLVAGPSSYIYIRENTLLAPNVHINTTSHRFKDKDKPIKEQGGNEERVTIGGDCWLGTGVVVLSGVAICNGSVVGANSVVTKDVEPFNVVAGNPAVFIKKRGE